MSALETALVYVAVGLPVVSTGAAALVLHLAWYWVLAVLLVSAVAAALLYGVSFWGALSHIPGPRPHLFFGHRQELLDEGHHEFFRRLVKEHGKVCKFFVGRRPNVLIADAELGKLVGAKMFPVFHNRPTPPGLLRQSTGLVGARDKQWKEIRSALVPTFNSNHLREMIPMMHQSLDNMLRRLSKAAQTGESIEALETYSDLTLEVIGRTAFGTVFPFQDPDAKLDNTQRQFRESVALIFSLSRPSNAKFAMIVAAFPFLFTILRTLFPGLTRRLVGAIHTIDSMSLKLTQERRQDPEMDKYRDFLTLLLKAQVKETGRHLNDIEVRDNSNTFLLAGFETTANTLSFATFCVASNPAVEAKLLQEIDRLLPDPNTRLTYEDLDKFEYLDWVMKESARMFPVAFLVREPDEDVTIGDYFLPKGTVVFVPSPVLHYDEQHFPQPNEFRPERWAPDCKENIQRHKFAYLPFGLGPRMCIGQRFAEQEAKLVMIRVYRQFVFRLHEKTQLPLRLEHGITSNAKGGIHVTVHPRNK